MANLETCTFSSIQITFRVAKAPLETLGLENEYDILVNAHGGGLTGQSDSIRLGVARALCQLDPTTAHL
jgi:small subunit ribosomal protein S9